jgi:hypothetical protein
MLRERKGLEVGVLSPGAPVAAELQAEASWVRDLRPAVLARCQFPDSVRGRAGHSDVLITKPAEW